MTIQKAMEVLCERACPSIKYRIFSEILQEPKTSQHMINLQKNILEDESVQQILAWQKDDGWLGGTFHSGYGPETGVRVLSEKGVSGEHPVIARALNALKNNPNFDAGCLEKVGKVLDQRQLGGSNMMRAVVFAYAGKEEEPLVRKEIENALEGFQYILRVAKIQNIVEEYKNKFVFKRDVKWPSIYHLRLLSLTKTWRNDKNMSTIIHAIKKLVEFSPIPDVKVRHQSQLMAPASAFMNDFKPKLDQLKPQDWMMWFHRMELLARLGVIHSIPELRSQVEQLKQYLVDNNGFFTIKLSHYYFHRWNMYVGLALEKDWKSPLCRVNDLTFRSMLILHYADQISQQSDISPV